MIEPTSPLSFRFLLISACATISVVVALLVRLGPDEHPAIRAATLRIEDPRAYFTHGNSSVQGHSVKGKMIQLEPPIRLPGRASGQNKTEIFLQVPPGKFLSLVPGTQGLQLDYPVGTYAARVESVLRNGPGGSTWSVADVRATRFEKSGQTFEVYRPQSRKVNAPLIGFAWKRGNAAAQKRADDWVFQAAQLSVSQGAAKRVAEKARSNNACASCHVPRRPEARKNRQFGSVHRGTDAGGLFVPRTLLQDDAPMENYAPIENNWDDPHIEISCSAGPPKLNEVENGRRAGCPDDEVPRAHLNLRAALASGDKRAELVCRGRMALIQLLDKTGRTRFEDELSSCSQAFR